MNSTDLTKIKESIAPVEKNLSILEIYSQLNIPSLGREIFFNLDQNGPLGSIFIPYIEDTKLTILKKQSLIGDSSPINTGLTQEVIQDIQSQFGYDAKKIIEGILGAVASKQENLKTKEFLETIAVQRQDITLSRNNNSRVIVEEISQAVGDYITQMNEDYFITYKANVVVPMKYAMSFSVRDVDKNLDIDGRQSYYMGRQGTARYFVDPDKENTDTVYVVLNEELNSGGFFCDYTKTITSSIDETGTEKYFIFSRYGIIENPKHSKTPMIVKFKVL